MGGGRGQTAKVRTLDNMSSNIGELEELLTSICKKLVDQPKEVVVEKADGRDFVHFEVTCAEGDVGTLVGYRGKHAVAIRTILKAAGAVMGIRVTVEIVSKDRDAYPHR